MTCTQSEYDLRCEWGRPGVEYLAPISDVVIIIDVLSFSTAVDIAVARGASILPHRWKDESAAAFAASKGALLAVPRMPETGYSLAPASLQSIPAGTVLVLPSPNGSTLSTIPSAALTYTACIRNAAAVAAHAQRHRARIAVIPAGEQWPGDALRPAIEDLIGAGAVLTNLPGRTSPEAETAIAVFDRFRNNLREALSRSGSGQELIERGFPSDVELAAEYGVSSAIPIFQQDRFVNAARL